MPISGIDNTSFSSIRGPFGSFGSALQVWDETRHPALRLLPGGQFVLTFVSNLRILMKSLSLLPYYLSEVLCY